jgi:hypothetical protein
MARQRLKRLMPTGKETKAPKKESLSVLALVLANLVPLAGVLFFHWDIAAVVLLYWTENVVIGLYTILKMAVVPLSPPGANIVKLFQIPFFCLHFGGFCGIHGMFLLVMFNLGGQVNTLFSGPAWGPLVFFQILFGVIRQLWNSRPPGMVWPVLCLLVSHGISFVQNFLLGGEYRTLTMEQLMRRPYARVFVMHVAIFAGAAPVMMLGSPMALLAILILLKIGLDVMLHAKSHAWTDAMFSEKK